MNRSLSRSVQMGTTHRNYFAVPWPNNLTHFFNHRRGSSIEEASYYFNLRRGFIPAFCIARKSGETSFISSCSFEAGFIPSKDPRERRGVIKTLSSKQRARVSSGWTGYLRTVTRGDDNSFMKRIMFLNFTVYFSEEDNLFYEEDHFFEFHGLFFWRG